MPSRMSSPWRWLQAAGVLYLVAWAVHTGDHVRRGFDVVTTEVSVLGTAAAVLQLVVIAGALRSRRWAPTAAVVIGVVDAIGIAAVHLLPRWSAFSDAFPHAHGTGVSGFSWFAAVLEIVSALAFALAGAYARREAAAGGGPAAMVTRTSGAPVNSPQPRAQATPGGA